MITIKVNPADDGMVIFLSFPNFMCFSSVERKYKLKPKPKVMISKKLHLLSYIFTAFYDARGPNETSTYSTHRKGFEK